MTSPTDQPPSPDGETHTDHSKLASAIERGIFASRWLLAPLYLGLTVSLLLLLVKFVQGTVGLKSHPYPRGMVAFARKSGGQGAAP